MTAHRDVPQGGRSVTTSCAVGRKIPNEPAQLKCAVSNQDQVEQMFRNINFEDTFTDFISNYWTTLSRLAFALE